VFLTPEQIKELTERTQHSAQLRVLRALGIDHKVRPDGSLVVLRAHVEQQLGCALPSAKLQEPEPDWEAVNA